MTGLANLNGGGTETLFKNTSLSVGRNQACDTGLTMDNLKEFDAIVVEVLLSGNMGTHTLTKDGLELLSDSEAVVNLGAYYDGYTWFSVVYGVSMTNGSLNVANREAAANSSGQITAIIVTGIK